MVYFLRCTFTAVVRRRVPKKSKTLSGTAKLASGGDQRPDIRLSDCRVKSVTHECRLETRKFPSMTVQRRDLAGI
jgi:hypothetical protein